MRNSLLIAASVSLMFFSASGGRGQNDPGNPYALTPAAGPWMICASSFTGPAAPQQAREYAHHLRTQYRLPAYVYDRGQELRQAQEQNLRTLPPGDRQARARLERIQEQCAVLIGGYPDMDAAHRHMIALRQMKTAAAEGETGKAVGQSPFEVAAISTETVNPLATCFVVPNPTLPKEARRPPDNDPFLKELNRGESLSVKNCRKPWTLAIAEYRGAAIIQQRSTSSTFLEKIGFSSKPGESLSVAAVNARNLAEALRKINIPAYVLHTRHSSIVTIGGFDNPDDAEMQRLLRQFSSLKFKDVQMLARPLPMKVPQL